MNPHLQIIVNVWRHGTEVDVTGKARIRATEAATDLHDQEENAVRLAEQLVRDTYRRFRAKQDEESPKNPVTE